MVQAWFVGCGSCGHCRVDFSGAMGFGVVSNFLNPFNFREMKKAKPFELLKKDKLPDAIDTESGRYYLDSNEYLGFGYWHPTHEDPNVWTRVENKPHKVKALKEELSSSLKSIVSFLYFDPLPNEQ